MSQEDMSQKPVEFLEHFKALLGSEAFRVVEPAIVENIRTTFGVERNVRELTSVVEIARRNFILL